MEQIYLFSIKTQLTRNNICETYFKILRHYNNKDNLDLYELKNLSDDMKIYNRFLMHNVVESNLKLYTEFFKSLIERRIKINNLIINKIKTITNGKEN